MKVNSFCFTDLHLQEKDDQKKLVFCGFNRLTGLGGGYEEIRDKYPNADIVMFSTSGHFIAEEIHDDIPVVSALEFEKSDIKAGVYDVENFESSYELGKEISSNIGAKAKGVCIISDGGMVNGTELMRGVNTNLTRDIPVFGGMAGDGTRFQQTMVGLNNDPSAGKVVVIGFYGDVLNVISNCDSGWTAMGLEFKITKSQENELIELNHKSAYNTLYEFLEPENQDEFAKNTLYYPFLLEEKGVGNVIRTPILVDHDKKTLTYAGNMPEGNTVKLMSSGTMQLLDSTLKVAENCHQKSDKNSFVLAISCVGRRVVLDDMANEEYTEIHSTFGDSGNYFGFYSYGEFSRDGFEENCKLHNQTLTLAVLTEN